MVGGHSRNVGKTSVVAGLISALPEFRLDRLKITQYGHGICSADGEPVTAPPPTTPGRSRKKQIAAGSSRLLHGSSVAGAERAWWVKTEQGRLAEAMPARSRNT